jgi:hypothetical protein
MRTIRGVLGAALALCLSVGVSACDPGSDEPQMEETTGGEKPEHEDGVVDDEEGLIDDDTFGDEGIIDDNTFDDEEGMVPDDAL